MIGKLLKGRGMRGLLDYLLAERDQKGDVRPRVRLIGGTFAGTTARQIAGEFAVLRSLRPRLEVAVVHETLRLPPDAPEPTDEQWLQIAQYWTSKMGFQAWVAIAHGDGHIHIAASRILIDGSVVSDFQDWTISERIVREIEKEFGLDIVKASHLLEPSRDWVQQKAPSQAQLAITAKTHLPLPTDIISATINTLLAGSPSVTEFVAGLEAAGIDVRPNIATTGKVSGFAYGIGDVLVTAKSLGRDYTWANLQRAGLSFDPDRDLPALHAARTKSLKRAGDRAPNQAKTSGPIEDTSILSTRAAEEYVSKSAANFVQAAGSVQFMVDRRPWSDAASSFTDFDQLLQPDTLHQLLTSRTSSSPIKAEIVDTRIIAVTDLSMSQVDWLDAIGLEPFVVTEVRPSVFEACIRLLPASDPAPSERVQRQVTAMVAEKVGGTACDSFFVPGFFNAEPQRGRKRRSMVKLRRALRVVARVGMQLVQTAISQFREMSGVRPTPHIKADRYFQHVLTSPQDQKSDALEQFLRRARKRPAPESTPALRASEQFSEASEETSASALPAPE